MYAFVDRITNLAATKGEDVIKNLLPLYFRGSGHTWHTLKLTSMKKDFLREASIRQIKIQLVKRFKERGSVALAALQSKTYGFPASSTYCLVGKKEI